MNPKRWLSSVFAAFLISACVGIPAVSFAQASDPGAVDPTEVLIPRPTRAEYPERPRLAMIAVAPVLPWAESPGVDQMDAWLEVAMLSAGLEQRFDRVEREQLDIAATELTWSVTADQTLGGVRNATSAMSIGRWVGCDLLMVAEVRGERPVKASEVSGAAQDGQLVPPRLYLTVIDPNTATKLAVADQPLVLPTAKPTASDIDRLAVAIRSTVEAADAKLRAASGKPVVMLLHFRNLSRNDRLDRLNVEVPAKLQGLAETAQNFRMVQVSEPQSSLAEQELLLTGLLESDPESWATAADVYLWGSVREVSTAEEDDGDALRVEPLAADPLAVPVELSLLLWNGRGDPKVFVQRATADEIDAAMEIVIQQVSASLQEPLPDTISTIARRKAAYLLAGDVMSHRSVPSFRYDDPSDGWRAERFFYWLNAARAARFLDARNPVLSRAAVAVGHPEWAGDPWAGFAAYTADLDQAIRQARSPVIRSRMSEYLEPAEFFGDMRPDEAFYDLVERRLVTLLVESFAVLGERSGDQVEHYSGVMEYTPPRLPLLPSLSETEQGERMMGLMGQAEALGREYARWKGDVRYELDHDFENEDALGSQMERRVFEETQSNFEEVLLTDLTRFFTAHQATDRAALTAAIDHWLPVIQSAVAAENADRPGEGLVISPSEDWPELYQIAIQTRHEDLLAVLQSQQTSTVIADTTSNGQLVDEPLSPPAATRNSPSDAFYNWSEVKTTRVNAEGESSPPQDIVGYSVRQSKGRIQLKLETSDEDGGKTSYRWVYSPPREKQSPPSVSRNRPLASLEDLPEEFDAQEVKRWLASQQNEGKLLGGVLDRSVSSPPPSRLGRRPDMAIGPQGRPRSIPSRSVDANPYAWIDDLPSLPRDMPPELERLIKAKREAPIPAKSRQEVLAENQRRRAMDWPLLEETGDLSDHAEGPMVDVHHLRVRVAGDSLPWPVLRTGNSRPEFGPLRWVHGWLAASTYPAVLENPRGPRFERGDDAHRDLRWLHPVSLADRLPGFDLPADVLVTDVAQASEDGTTWVATHGNGLLRINIDHARDQTQSQSMTTRDGLFDQRLRRLLVVGDQLLAFGYGGVSVLSDLEEKRPTIRDGQPKKLSTGDPAFAVGEYAYFANPMGGWWNPASGEVVLLDDWLQEHLSAPYDVIGGFVQGDRSWVILTDRLVCIESNLLTHHTFPLPVPGHRSLVGVADDDVVWLAYPDPVQPEAARSETDVNQWRHFDPVAYRNDTNEPPSRRSSRLVAIESATGKLLGQASFEGQAQQIALGAGEIFVAAPSGLWELSVFDRDQLLNAMAEAESTMYTVSDPEQITIQRLALVSEAMPLIRASTLGDVEEVTRLIEDDPDTIDQQDPSTGLTPLLAAVRYGHLEIAEQLIEAGADPQLKSEVTPWMRPLMMSAMRDDVAIFSLLVNHGAIRRGHNQRLGTEAHAAVLHESYGVLEALPSSSSSSLDRFARTSRVTLIPAKGRLTLNLNWFTPLLLAVDRGDARAVAALVKAGHRVCSPGARDGEEYLSPLCLAASLGRGDLLRLMLADPRDHWHAEHGDLWNASPWDYAVWFDQPDAISAMLDAGIKPPNEPDLLLVAARAGSMPLLEILHRGGLDLNHVWTVSATTERPGRPDVGRRALHMTVLTTAVSHGHHHLIDPMVSRFGIDLETDLAGDKQHDLLLRLMLERGDLDAAIDLVADRADVDGASNAYSPATLLSLVAEQGELQAVEFLLRLGAGPIVKGRDGRNALQVADDPQVKAMLESVSR